MWVSLIISKADRYRVRALNKPKEAHEPTCLLPPFDAGHHCALEPQLHPLQVAPRAAPRRPSKKLRDTPRAGKRLSVVGTRLSDREPSNHRQRELPTMQNATALVEPASSSVFPPLLENVYFLAYVSGAVSFWLTTGTFFYLQVLSGNATQLEAWRPRGKHGMASWTRCDVPDHPNLGHRLPHDF
eukprot:SAG31_NODE_433_length_15750_cov_6.132579_9_plen_185_part_00